MRVLVTGCRHWECHDLADQVVSRLLARHGPTFTIVHGDAPGVDSAFDAAAKAHGLPTEPHPARWDDLTSPGSRLGVRRDGTQYNAYAGPQRNAEMVKAGADLCLAIHRDIRSSKGTLGCARLAIANGIPTWLISDENCAMRQLTMKDLT